MPDPKPSESAALRPESETPEAAEDVWDETPLPLSPAERLALTVISLTRRLTEADRPVRTLEIKLRDLKDRLQRRVENEL